jgi:ANTAR domain
MPRSELAERSASLFALASATPERSLHELTLLTAAQVPGCAAVTAALWEDGELIAHAASHPDPPRLLELQLSAGRGPVIEALASGGPVYCADTLTEQRWPEYGAAALEIGIRCSVTLAHLGPAQVTLALFGTRPRAIAGQQLEVAELLVVYGGAVLGAVADYSSSVRTASQLRDAAEGRAIVEQATGILMHSLGCTAAEALERMREVSQRSNIKTIAVAQRVIDGHRIARGPRGDRAADKPGNSANGRGRAADRLVP